LKESGYKPGIIDGIWGKNTHNAIKDFQRKEELEITGGINSKTVKKLGVDMIRVNFLMFSLLVLILSSSCSIGTLKLYPGPELPEYQLANIGNSNSNISVYKIDSYEDMRLGVAAPIGVTAKENAEVLPGIHSFSVSTSFKGVPATTLEADLEAGKEYIFSFGWQKFPENVVIEGNAGRTVRLNGCRFARLASTDSIPLYSERFPPVECATFEQLRNAGGRPADCYIDDEGTHIGFFPYLYERGKYYKPVSKIIRLKYSN